MIPILISVMALIVSAATLTLVLCSGRRPVEPASVVVADAPSHRWVFTVDCSEGEWARFAWALRRSPRRDMGFTVSLTAPWLVEAKTRRPKAEANEILDWTGRACGLSPFRYVGDRAV